MSKLNEMANAIGNALARDSTGQCLLCSTDEQCRELARALLKAMREPPKGFEKIVYHGDYGDDVWREMIDVILSSP